MSKYYTFLLEIVLPYWNLHAVGEISLCGLDKERG